MPDIRSQQRIGIDDRSAQQSEADVIVWRHSQHVAEWAFIAQAGRGARHVRSHRDSPESQLIIRKQIAGERKQQA